MKLKLMVLACLGIAVCGGATAGSKGFGFGPVGYTAPANSGTRTETVTYGQTYSKQAGHSGRTPGLYQTSTGVPWLVYTSSSARKGRAALQGSPAMRAAMAHASSKWKSPYAARVKTEQGDAMLRVVTVDGVSFAVMRNIRAKNVLKVMFSNEAYFQIMDHGIKAAGCTKTGGTVIRNGKYSVQNLAAPVRC